MYTIVRMANTILRYIHYSIPLTLVEMLMGQLNAVQHFRYRHKVIFLTCSTQNHGYWDCVCVLWAKDVTAQVNFFYINVNHLNKMQNILSSLNTKHNYSIILMSLSR